MKKANIYFLMAVLAAILFTGCKNEEKKKEVVETKAPVLKEEMVNYQVDSLQMSSYVVYDSNQQGQRPAVLVIHEWWGLNDYAKMRARKLAELGYIAMAVDMYGNGQTGPDPDAAGKLAMPFYKNPDMAKKHVEAALAQIRKKSMTDTANVAVIGYCFGGAVALGVARMGIDVKAAVSFHGNLNVVPASKELLKAEVLVCHGNADPFVPQAEVDQFKKQMDSIGAKYVFKGYDSTTHAFTNPEATAMGKRFNIPIRYNAVADSTSWEEMKVFLKRILQ